MSNEPKAASLSASEDREPSATMDTAPMWLFMLAGLLFFGGAIYSDYRSANFDSKVYEPYPSAKYLEDIQPKSEDEKVLRLGRDVYNNVCSVCHQPGGGGTPGQFPPLVDSEWVLAPKPDRLVRLVQHGVAGPLMVKGQQWNAAMPNMGESLNMSDADMAAVLSYIRTSWGNKAPIVTPEQVSAIRTAIKGRTSPWTEAELNAVPVE